MFDMEIEGRMVRIRPRATVWCEHDGWIELERTEAKSLAQTIIEQRVWDHEDEEGEDG